MFRTKSVFTFLGLVGLILWVSCNSSTPSNTSNQTKTDSRELVPEPDLNLRLHGEKNVIEKLIRLKELDITVWVQQIGVKSPTQVFNEQWPEGIETTFNLWTDSNNVLVCLGEYPYSESGDWSIALTHYFDQRGNTFAFECSTSFYNSICTDELAIEQIATFYNTNHQRIDSTYLLRDSNGATLARDSCQFPYEYPYDIYPTSQKLLSSIELMDVIEEVR